MCVIFRTLFDLRTVSAAGGSISGVSRRSSAGSISTFREPSNRGRIKSLPLIFVPTDVFEDTLLIRTGWLLCFHCLTSPRHQAPNFSNSPILIEARLGSLFLPGSYQVSVLNSTEKASISTKLKSPQKTQLQKHIFTTPNFIQRFLNQYSTPQRI